MGSGLYSALCRCPHHKMLGGWVALIGLIFLLGNLGVLAPHIVSIGWPVILILAGLQKAFDRACKCCAPHSHEGSQGGGQGCC